MPARVRECRVVRMEERTSLCRHWRMKCGQRMYLWMRRREQALSVKREV
jgi:hypothetical protein